MNFRNVLVLAPHTDDGEFGAGGYINKLINKGATITYVAFANCDKSLPPHQKGLLASECEIATKTLGIKKVMFFDYEVRKLNFFRQDILEQMVVLNKQIKPDLVLLPSSNDIHQDHKTIYEEGIRAFRYTTILGYESAKNNLTFKNNLFIKLQLQHLNKKIKAVLCYKTQNKKKYASPTYITALAITRGFQAGTTYAECLEVIRMIM